MADATTTVAVEFLADASKVEAEAAKVEGTGGKFKSWAKGVGTVIAGAFAVDKIKDFVAAGSELQDQLSASQVIFGDAAKGVESWSKTTTASFGISQNAALDAANTFATFGKSAGLTGPDLAGFSEQLTGLSGDLASFRGTSTEEAIQAVGAALRGETEPIRKYGVMLDDSTLKARAMSMGLLESSVDMEKVKARQLALTQAQKAYNDAVAKHGPQSEEAAIASQKVELAQAKLAGAMEGTTQKALTPQQKVLAAQAEILAQTSDAQGDFARTSDSAANKQKLLSAQMEDLQTTIGTALLPVVQTIVPLFGALAGFIEQNATWLVPLVGAILALVAAYKIFVAIQTAVNAVLALFGVTTTVALGPIILIALGIAALIAAVILLWKNWDTIWAWITNAVAVAWEAIKGAFSAAWDFIQGIWDQILGIAQSVLGWIRDNWPLLLAILTGPFGIAVKLILDNWDSILGFFKSLPGTIAGFLSTLGGIIAAPFQWAWDQITKIYDWIKTGISGAVDAFKGIWNAFARGWNAIEIEVPSVHIPWPIDKDVGGFTLDVPDLPEFAKGGIVRSPTLAVVGEAGPEAIIPLRNRTPARAGPAVVIQNATFTEQADIELFMRRVAWAAQTDRI